MRMRSYDRIVEQWVEHRYALRTDELVLIDRLLERSPVGARVLDLGCGTGRPIAWRGVFV